MVRTVDVLSHAAQERILRESYLPLDYFTRFVATADNLDHCLSAG